MKDRLDDNEQVSNDIILYDIKDVWDELYAMLKSLFECDTDISIAVMERGGIKFSLLTDLSDINKTLGEVDITKDGLPVEIKFNKIIYGFKEKYFYSAIIHEMCHVAATLSDVLDGNFNLEDYKKCNGHTDSWQKRANNFNNYRTKKGNKIFEIVPYLTKELSIKDMLE